MAKEIKMSGVVGDVFEGIDTFRTLLMDAGGVVLVRDFILDNCGGYKKGDRIVVTVDACGEEEYYYPPKPEH